MSGFTAAWLDLREPADRQARNTVLLDHARQWLEDSSGTAGESIVVDLGAGTGATWRAMSLPAGARWYLVDDDPVLLATAQARHGQGRHGRPDRFTTCVHDLNDIPGLPLDRASLVTASALFDLVSASYLAALVNRLVTLGPVSGLYAALNYDGTTQWLPGHPHDDAILRAFNTHQRSDKGFGPALGPEAGNVLVESLVGAGYRVETAYSPWQLRGEQSGALISALIDGIAGAAAEVGSLSPAGLAAWRDFRLQQVFRCTCTVGHIDVLALPALQPGN